MSRSKWAEGCKINVFWVNEIFGVIYVTVYLLHYFQHSGHSFKPLDEEYAVHKQKITDEINALRNRLMELDGLYILYTLYNIHYIPYTVYSMHVYMIII